MIRYVAGRVLATVVLLLVTAVGTFLLMRVVPADPAQLAAGLNATPEQVARVREQLGLDQPLYVQLFQFLGNLLRGDLGTSLMTHRPVAQDIALYFPATLELVVSSLLLVLVVGLPLGVYAVSGRPRFLAGMTRIGAFIAMGLPSFVLALLLQIIVFGELGWAPLGGRTSEPKPPRITGVQTLDYLLVGDVAGFRDTAAHLVLPSIALAVGSIGLIVRYVESEYDRVRRSDYLVTARAKGAIGGHLFWHHTARNMLPSVLTIVGMVFGWSLAGSVLVESVFSWPGLGTYILNSISAFDYSPVIISTLLLVGCFAIINLFVDIAHVIVDPRVKANLA